MALEVGKLVGEGLATDAPMFRILVEMALDPVGSNEDKCEVHGAMAGRGVAGNEAEV